MVLNGSKPCASQWTGQCKCTHVKFSTRRTPHALTAHTRSSHDITSHHVTSHNRSRALIAPSRLRKEASRATFFKGTRTVRSQVPFVKTTCHLLVLELSVLPDGLTFTIAPLLPLSRGSVTHRQQLRRRCAAASRWS